MTTEQVSILLTLAAANFPTLQDKDMGPTLILWREMLSDIPFEIARPAVLKVLTTSKFFPTVAEIREAAASLTTGQAMSAIEAWGLAFAAIEQYGNYRELEAMKSLPAEVACFVKRFGWQELCTSEEPDVIRGQFIRLWENYSKQQKEIAVLPENIRQLIGETAKTLTLSWDK